MASIPQTPTTIRLTAPTADNTPLKRDLSSSGVFIYGNLDEQKAAVIQALGNQIPEVDLEFMLSNILPVSSVDQHRTLDALIEQGHWSENSGWQEFGGVPPKKTVGREPLVFGRMRAINMQILANAKFSSGFIPLRSLELRDSPDSAPESDTEVATRPDACGLLETFIPIHTSSWQKESPNSTRLLHWFDIAYSLEYKKDDSIEKSNDVCFLPFPFASCLSFLHFLFLISLSNHLEYSQDIMEHASCYERRQPPPLYIWDHDRECQ